jgi:hypothetical protein
MRQGSVPGRPTCPGCGRVLDGFTCVNGSRAMQPGDYSVCGYCCAPLEWDGFAYSRLTGSALVLARLNRGFLRAEAVARRARGVLGR